jgi:hypothetical protein
VLSTLLALVVLGLVPKLVDRLPGKAVDRADR